MTQLQWWFRAMRPATLVLSIAPTAVGFAWAWRHAQQLDWFSAVLTLMCAVSLQIIANGVNELGDYRRGADTPERFGPVRAIAVGAIAPRAMQRAVVVLSAMVLTLGLVLVARVGWWLLVVGVSALVLAWLYTSGSRPLAYIGLGEVVALVFFGPVPALGAYAIAHSTVAIEPLLSGIAFGALAAAVLGINNLRDINVDRAAGKYTLAVQFGRHRATRLVQLLLLLPLAIVAVMSIQYVTVSVAIVVMPILWSIARQLQHAHGRQYNGLLVRTALATGMFAVLLIAGIIASKTWSDTVVEIP
ncbi:MAG: 1,4-dihydroxy-2-naphthoate octaprenyltransferase [Chlorobi bacterium]|nr:1,4-dihydroxy-2-naphthoate octaprenyltransferase [Chlorobiota bacterium]